MRAFLVTATDGVISGALSEVEPTTLEGDVLIDVEFAGVNYKDSMVLRPGNKVARRNPLIPGVDLAGTVVSAGPAGPPPGTAVLAHCYGVGVSHHGGFAQQARIPAEWVVTLPDGLDARRAMILGTAGFTAMASLNALRAHGMTPSDGPLLVTGAAGGVGSSAVALSSAAGFEVVASSGRPHESAFLTALGASRIIGRDEIDDRPDRTLGTERWAGAIDCVGGSTLAAILRSLRYGAGVAASGLTGGSEISTTVFPFIVRAVALLGIDAVEMDHAERQAIWDALAISLAPSMIDQLCERTISLDEIPAALSQIAEGKIRGRTIVDLSL